MRVFQFHYCYPAYFDYLAKRHADVSDMSFERRLALLLEHRYNAVHILEPIYRRDPELGVTVANDPLLQGKWAAEHGMTSRDLTVILLAQIEEHRAEVVYSLDPIHWDSAFVRRLPGCVKKTICWRAAPILNADLSAYDLRVCNFPNFLNKWTAQGMRSAYFSPSHDPRMRDFANEERRPIDICFVGGYSDLHVRRNRLLEVLASLADKHRVVLALTHPQHRPLINLPLLRRIPSPFPYLPENLRRIAVPPVFGLEMYQLFGQAKVVFNGFGEIAEEYRGNMRSFEAMGCGACMLSEAGIYPENMVAGVHFETFRDEAEMKCKLQTSLATPAQARNMGRLAAGNLEKHYSKPAQWKAFQDLVASI